MTVLANRVGIVTGGGRGIGRAIALALSKAGARLLLVSRTKSELEETEREIREAGGTARILAEDVSHPDTAPRAVAMCRDAFGVVDILVNAAGIIGPIGPVEETTLDDWRRTIDVNLTATFLFIKAVLPVMKKQMRGKIINLSGGGASNGFPLHAAYASTKVSIVRLTETVAMEVQEYNIDVNAIAPGTVNTRMAEEMLAAGRRGGESEYQRLVEQKKTGGVPPEKAAELAVFLASASSNGLSGRLVSAVWDSWQSWSADEIERIRKGELLQLRRMMDKK